jgi:hypothetical protein
MSAKIISLPLGSAISIDVLGNGTYQQLSEHNRAPISVTMDRIENAVRMANGSMRKFFVAEKRNVSISWNMLPSFSNLTVDGKYGAMDIKDFYSSAVGKGSFKVKLYYGKNQTSPYSARNEGGTDAFLTMMFTSCSFELVKRNVKNSSSDPAQEFWNVSLSLTEV